MENRHGQCARGSAHIPTPLHRTRTVIGTEATLGLRKKRAPPSRLLALKDHPTASRTRTLLRAPGGVCMMLRKCDRLYQSSRLSLIKCRLSRTRKGLQVRGDKPATPRETDLIVRPDDNPRRQGGGDVASNRIFTIKLPRLSMYEEEFINPLLSKLFNNIYFYYVYYV